VLGRERIMMSRADGVVAHRNLFQLREQVLMGLVCGSFVWDRRT
jgi:hypothetical protein